MRKMTRSHPSSPRAGPEGWWSLGLASSSNSDSSVIRCKMLPCCPLAVQHPLPHTLWLPKPLLPQSPPTLLPQEHPCSAPRGAEHFTWLTRDQPGADIWQRTAWASAQVQSGPSHQLGSTLGKGGYFWNLPQTSLPQSDFPALFTRVFHHQYYHQTP